MINLYQSGKSLACLANKYNTTTYTIKKILIQNNVETRTRSQQNVFTNQERAKKVDHNYFDNIDTNEKAWLLGFLAADGAIAEKRNSIKIGLSSIDREILEKIQKEIKSERQILDYETNKGFQISELVWSSGNHKTQLAKYGIIPRKTYKAMRLPDLDLEKQLSFILGYYDGDGCFKDDGTTCRIEICSYRPELLIEFSQVLNKLCNCNRQVYQEPHRDNYYTLTYSTKNTITILNKMYSLNSLFLSRKHNKYINWLNKNNYRI